MPDYCPSCESNDVESYLNDEGYCLDCGAHWNGVEEDEEDA